MSGGLSIIIPVFNEEKTIEEILRRVGMVDLGAFQKEIVIVDDGSRDRTSEILKKYARDYRVIYHDINRGKGAAIKTAIPYLSGQYTIIQDADLEYDPQDLRTLLDEIERAGADAVYGSRNLGKTQKGYPHYYFGGRFLTWLFNILYGAYLTDINTGYKLFKTDILKTLSLKSDGFEFCEEVTAKLIKRGCKIVEVPISYSPRTFKEGKKISFKDGLTGIWTIVKYRFK